MGDITHQNTAQAQTSAERAFELELLAKLKDAPRYSDVARFLEKAGISDEAVATATGANPRTISKWRESEASPPKIKEQREHLDELKVVMIHLIDDGTLPLDAIVQWLELMNERLNRARPLDAIREGRWADVIAAADAAWIRR